MLLERGANPKLADWKGTDAFAAASAPSFTKSGPKTHIIELLKAAAKGAPRAGSSNSNSASPSARSPAARLVAKLKVAAAKRSEEQIVDACREMSEFAENDYAEVELNEAGAIEVLGSWPCTMHFPLYRDID